MTQTEETAQKFAEALLAPLRDVGTLLAKQIDELRAKVRQQHVKALQDNSR